MTSHHTQHAPAGSTRPVNEADLLEQHTPVDPLVNDELEPIDQAVDHESGDDADRWDQHQPVPTAEDDYPHGPVEAG